MFDYGANRPAGASANWNTIATLYDDRYSSTSDNLSARAGIEIGGLEKGLLQGLKLTVNYGLDLVNAAAYTYYNPYNGNSVGVSGNISKGTGRTFVHTLNELLTYDRRFDKHHIDLLAGHEFYKYTYDYLAASKTGFPFGGLYELDAATNITGASSYKNQYAVEAYLSRLNYDYDDKYFFSASFRTDASSRFYKDNRWGTFWSVGASWRASQEAFLKDVDWINNLSIKASYGIQGNDNIGSYYAWQSFYDLGFPNASMSGAAITSLENKEVTWEKNANLNIGIEAHLFDRVSATVEWYTRKTTDILMEFPMATSLGFDGYNKNVGSMENVGMDISLSAEIIKTADLTWKVGALASFVRNKVLQLADKPEIISGSYIIKVGETINSFYTATSAGVNPATGQQLYWAWNTDADGNKLERYATASQDEATKWRDVQGSRIPKLYGSLSSEFSYKNFDLNILCTYSIGGKILDGVYRTLLYGNYVGQAKSKMLERAWKQPGDLTDIPRIEIGKTYITTNDDLIDASYFSVKTISLGYNLPAKWAKTIKLETVRIAASAENVLLFTHLKGMDPQFNFSGGTNFGYVPPRIVSLGLEVKF